MILIINIIMERRMQMKGEARAVLQSYLRQRGLKMTRPREAVLRAFLDAEGHVTTDTLITAARRIDPRIGQATVFRTVKLLTEAGLARGACSDEGPRQYEHAYRHSHHDHLVCVECGAIVEFADTTIEKAQEAIYKKYGYQSSGHRLELLGRCPSCAAHQGSEGRTPARSRKRGRNSG
jgi:Fur family ferric uptake transcriptional regulator